MKFANFAYTLVVFLSLLTVSRTYATPLDCTGGCTDQSYAGAVFDTSEEKPSGTGVFNTFVQIQHKDSEQGYNTTANGVFDNDSSNVHNHEINLSDVPIKIISGISYREFVLDLNESNHTSDISLDGLQLYLSDTPNQSTTTVSSLGTLAYDLDSSANNNVLLDYALNGSGSGGSDLFVYIPESLFTAAKVSVNLADPYVYLWSQFSNSDAGFEEWATQKVTAGDPVPEPISGALLLMGLSSLGMRFKRKNA